MNIKQIGPEEQNEHFAASWRELKLRSGISRLVAFAGLVSIPLTFHAGPSPWLLLLLAFASVASAAYLSELFIKAFLCPRCGHKFFDAGCSPGPIALPDKPCAHCGLPLWATEKP